MVCVLYPLDRSSLWVPVFLLVLGRIQYRFLFWVGAIQYRFLFFLRFIQYRFSTVDKKQIGLQICVGQFWVEHTRLELVTS